MAPKLTSPTAVLPPTMAFAFCKATNIFTWMLGQRCPATQNPRASFHSTVVCGTQLPAQGRPVLLSTPWGGDMFLVPSQCVFPTLSSHPPVECGPREGAGVLESPCGRSPSHQNTCVGLWRERETHLFAAMERGGSRWSSVASPEWEPVPSSHLPLHTSKWKGHSFSLPRVSASENGTSVYLVFKSNTSVSSLTLFVPAYLTSANNLKTHPAHGHFVTAPQLTAGPTPSSWTTRVFALLFLVGLPPATGPFPLLVYCPHQHLGELFKTEVLSHHSPRQKSMQWLPMVSEMKSRLGNPGVEATHSRLLDNLSKPLPTSLSLHLC